MINRIGRGGFFNQKSGGDGQSSQPWTTNTGGPSGSLTPSQSSRGGYAQYRGRGRGDGGAFQSGQQSQQNSFSQPQQQTSGGDDQSSQPWTTSTGGASGSLPVVMVTDSISPGEDVEQLPSPTSVQTGSSLLSPSPISRVSSSRKVVEQMMCLA